MCRQGFAGAGRSEPQQYYFLKYEPVEHSLLHGVVWCGVVWVVTAGRLSPGGLHDLHHFREQMMLARMI